MIIGRWGRCRNYRYSVNKWRTDWYCGEVVGLLVGLSNSLSNMNVLRGLFRS